jgi:hypothetical protein
MFFLSIISCNNPNKKIIGKWKMTAYNYKDFIDTPSLDMPIVEFMENGKYHFTHKNINQNGNFEIKNDSLISSLDGYPENDPLTNLNINGKISFTSENYFEIDRPSMHPTFERINYK